MTYTSCCFIYRKENMRMEEKKNAYRVLLGKLEEKI
jgi:hypothetical protein